MIKGPTPSSMLIAVKAALFRGRLILLNSAPMLMIGKRIIIQPQTNCHYLMISQNSSIKNDQYVGIKIMLIRYF